MFPQLARPRGWRAPLALVALIGLIVGACTAPPEGVDAAAVAQSLCTGPGQALASNWNGSTLVAVVASTGAEVSKWVTTGNGPGPTSPWASLEPTAPVAFCYFDGDFTGIPGVAGMTLTYERMLILVPDHGEADVYAVGPKSMSLAGPKEPSP